MALLRRPTRSWRSSLLALAAATSVAACGGDGDAAGAEAEAPAVAIAMFRFQPQRLEVSTGTTVTWRNDDDILHTVTSGAPGRPIGDFDEELADKGATATVTFDRAGTFVYYCDRHPEAMKAEVVVK